MASEIPPESLPPELRPPTKSRTRSFTVPANTNTVVLRLERQRYVSIAQAGRRIVRSDVAGGPVCFRLEPGDYELETDGEVAGIETSLQQGTSTAAFGGAKRAPSLFRVTSDAPDRHTVDGIGELKADGAASTTITVQKTSLDGQAQTAASDDDEVFVRTTGGSVLSADGGARVRSLRLSNGQARFRLVSDTQPRLVQLTVFGQPSTFPFPAQLPLEFV